MSKELELWNFIAERLCRNERVILLIVAESSGSSPGRAGYKMAVAADGELIGSIGGGVMEVNLVKRAKNVLSTGSTANTVAELIEQEHRKNSPHASGMICSGRQTVIFKLLTPDELAAVDRILKAFPGDRGDVLIMTKSDIACGPDWCGTRNLQCGGDAPIVFERGKDGFSYIEELDRFDSLFIIGGGHCALALSEVMSNLGFRISIYDDRPALNTVEKNRFAQEITIVDGYDKIADHIPDGEDVYVVVMTLGYSSDAVVIRQLIDHNVRYLGLLGSKAKIATMLNELRKDGIDPADRIHTPIGLPINSRTPEEIAISIAAEIIAVKNGA